MIKIVEINEIERVMEIIDDAISLLSINSTQWQQGYPNKDTFINDINNKDLYGYYENNNLVGVMALVKGFNKDYETIDGKWEYISGDNDLTIHRIAVKKEYHHNKIGDKLFKYVIEYAKENNIQSIKVDTTKVNQPLNHLALSNGFKYKGIIHLARKEKDNERLAYEYILKD